MSNIHLLNKLLYAINTKLIKIFAWNILGMISIEQFIDFTVIHDSYQYKFIKKIRKPHNNLSIITKNGNFFAIHFMNLISSKKKIFVVDDGVFWNISNNWQYSGILGNQTNVWSRWECH